MKKEDSVVVAEKEGRFISFDKEDITSTRTKGA